MANNTSNWQKARVGSFLTKVRRHVDTTPNTLYHQIGIRSFGKGIFHKEPVTGEELGNKQIYWVEPGDFTLNIVFAWEGAVALVSERERGMCASHRFPTFLIDNTSCDPNFLLAYFKTEIGVEQLALASPGGAGRNRTLNQSEFLNLIIPLPPLSEQRKIADILSTWDRTIDLTAQLIGAKQQRKRGLMQQLLTGQRRFAEFDLIDKQEVAGRSIPTDWSIAAIQEISLRISRGKAPSYTDTSSSILAVNQKCVRNGRVDASFARSHSEGKMLLPSEYLVDGDICVNSTGTGTAGRVGLWNELNNQKQYFVDSHVTLVRVDQSKVVPRYLCEFLNLPRTRVQLEAQCIFGGTNQVELSRAEFAEFQVVLPPLEEQRRIATVLQACDQELALLEQKRELLQQQKQGLMQQLLTGRVRVL